MINTLIVVGNIGKPPKFSTDDSGKATTRFSIAISQHGKYKNRPIWLQCTANGPVANFIRDNIGSGEKVTLHGSLMHTDTDSGGFHWMYVKDVENHQWKQAKEQLQSHQYNKENVFGN